MADLKLKESIYYQIPDVYCTVSIQRYEHHETNELVEETRYDFDFNHNFIEKGSIIPSPPKTKKEPFVKLSLIVGIDNITAIQNGIQQQDKHENAFILIVSEDLKTIVVEERKNITTLCPLTVFIDLGSE